MDRTSKPPSTRRNKQNPSRSATEQAADLARIFKAIKIEFSLVSETLRTRTYAGSCSPLQRTLNDHFNRLKQDGSLVLPTHAVKALIDHALTCPGVYQKIITMKSIQDGMIAAGMIDEMCQSFPDAFQIIFGTTRRSVSVGEWDAIIKAFPALFGEYMREGRITDAVLS